MVVLGGGSLLLGRNYGYQPTVSMGIVAGALCVGGLALFVKKPISFWIAFGATLIVMGFAVASFVLKRMVGLPLPPIIALVAGLYLCFRLVLSRFAFRPRPPLPDDETTETT
jgi:hypothetical protein